MKLAVHNSWLEWMLLAGLAFCTEYGASQTTILLRAANISRDTIRLSDLLLPEASNEVRRAAEQIDLGRTPQCDSVRFFEPADIEKRTLSSPALRKLTLSGTVSVRRTCFPILRDAVQKVISEFVKEKVKDAEALNLSAQWSDSIFALQENPVLGIAQAIPDPARAALQIRLRCVEHTVCPSFWVTVPTRQRPHLLFTAATVHEIKKDSALVESGQRVMLIIDDPPMHMQLRVTCLQRGSLGAQVRAMDTSSHRVFQAEVTGAGTLMAHL